MITLQSNRGQEFIDPLISLIRSRSIRQFPARKALGLVSKALYKQYLIPHPEDLKNISIYENYVNKGYTGDYDNSIDYISGYIIYPLIGDRFYFTTKAIRDKPLDLNKIKFLLNYIVGTCTKKNNGNYFDNLQLTSDVTLFFNSFIKFINTATTVQQERKRYITMLNMMLKDIAYMGIFNSIVNLQPLNIAVKYLDYEIIDILLSYVGNKRKTLTTLSDFYESPITTAEKIEDPKERQKMVNYLVLALSDLS